MLFPRLYNLFLTRQVLVNFKSEGQAARLYFALLVFMSRPKVLAVLKEICPVQVEFAGFFSACSRSEKRLKIEGY
jgi:hypothetical protein